MASQEVDINRYNLYNDTRIRLFVQSGHCWQQLSREVLHTKEIRWWLFPRKLPRHHRCRFQIQVHCYRWRSITVSGDIVKLQIWDTAGQERFRTITGAYYKGAHAIIIVYDITKEESFADIEEFWLSEVLELSCRSRNMLFLMYSFSFSVTNLTPLTRPGKFLPKRLQNFASLGTLVSQRWVQNRVIILLRLSTEWLKA